MPPYQQVWRRLLEFRHNADRIVVWEDLRPEDAGRPVANVEGPAAVAAELDLPEDLGPPVVAVVAPEPEPADVQSLLAPGGWWRPRTDGKTGRRTTDRPGGHLISVAALVSSTLSRPVWP